MSADKDITPRLNDMKVAHALLTEMKMSAEAGAYEPISYLAEIAEALTDASHLWREGAVAQVARILVDAAGMEDLYDKPLTSPLLAGWQEVQAPATWLEAEKGESWALLLDDGSQGAYLFNGHGFVGQVARSGGVEIGRDSPTIKAGIRIWANSYSVEVH